MSFVPMNPDLPCYDKATLRFNESFFLSEITWQIQSGEIWAIVGPNGSGKSALAASLGGGGELITGAIHHLPAEVAVVSLETQAELIERERQRDDSDLTDEVFPGTPLGEMLNETCADHALLAELIHIYRFDHMLDRGFRKLSTGESRKVLLARALTSSAGFLVIDEPFEGLDAGSTPLVRDIIGRVAGVKTMVLVFNRFDEIPDYVTHLLYLEQGKCLHQVPRGDAGLVSNLSQLLHLKTSEVTVPGPDPASLTPALKPGDPLARLNQVTVRYGEVTVFSNVDWEISPGTHWQLTGPNGSGKTCLLNLITGDNPQCYANDIYVFGYQRGKGESIWDIKRYIGYVSTALQWEYRVSISCLNVIISGFYDSIGLYQKASDLQREIASQWLAVVGMGHCAQLPFNKLSYGDQRLLLIARAMVKHPKLLILDEPCLGLDDMNRQLVLALIEKICAGSESTVLYVNHHAEDRISGIDNYLALSGAA